MINSSHLHEPSVVKELGKLVSQARLPSSLTIPHCFRMVGYARPLETGFRSNGSHHRVHLTCGIRSVLQALVLAFGMY